MPFFTFARMPLRRQIKASLEGDPPLGFLPVMVRRFMRFVCRLEVVPEGEEAAHDPPWVPACVKEEPSTVVEGTRLDAALPEVKEEGASEAPSWSELSLSMLFTIILRDLRLIKGGHLSDTDQLFTSEPHLGF